MIIDVHVHYGHRERQLEPSFEEGLLQKYSTLGIQCAAVFGLGMTLCKANDASSGSSTLMPKWGNFNAEVLQFFHNRPDFVLPVAWFRLDYDDISLIDDFALRGFRGLKFNHPQEDYDSQKYYHIYDKAAAHGFVLNFHTGFANGAGRKFGSTSARMRVQAVEAIARTFPQSMVLISHFGFPEYEAAGALARILPNFYLDISPSGPPAASPDLVRDDLKERKLIGRHIPPDKLLFGSDVYLERVDEQIHKWGVLFDEIGLTSADKDHIWYKNAQKVYRKDDVQRDQ